MSDPWVDLAIFTFGAGMGSCGFIVRALLAPYAPEGLPCPHAFCKNRLPRMGSWNAQGAGGWMVETCPVCEGAVLYNPYIGKGHDLHPQDKYIRVHKAGA